MHTSDVKDSLCIDNMQPDKYLGCIYSYNMSARVVIIKSNLGSNLNNSLQA